jgi:hypothetical protein
MATGRYWSGEGLTIPKEWAGVRETNGYTRTWVIDSEDDLASKEPA